MHAQVAFAPEKYRDKWGTKAEYTLLRKHLTKDGYLRIAPEVFVRIVPNRKAAEKHYRRLSEVAPRTGTVRVLRLTEKQYAKCFYLTGGPDYQEANVSAKSHIML